MLSLVAVSGGGGEVWYHLHGASDSETFSGGHVVGRLAERAAQQAAQEEQQ